MTEREPNEPVGVEPCPVSRATLWRLAAGVVAVYAFALLVILLARSSI